MMRELQLKIGSSKKMGQSIAEYGILISVVAAALLAMQIYMKRGIQAVIRDSTAQFGNQDYTPDAKDAMATDVSMWSESNSEFGLSQESTAAGTVTTYTTAEVSNTSGISTYFIEDEL